MNSTKLRIIVADDDRIVRNYFQVMLERMGHEVVALAENGSELLERSSRRNPIT